MQDFRDLTIKLATDLIQKPSITPEDAGALVLLSNELEKLGFTCELMLCSDKQHPEQPPVLNLYATIGQGQPHLCFAGHTDVVPPGPDHNWKYPPFSATIEKVSPDKQILYGRGASDMKGAIAAFVGATAQFLQSDLPFGKISLLITGDEEGIAINGTRKVLEKLETRQEHIDICIVGEPVSKSTVGDIVKVGARGSATFFLEVRGKQGHVAYHDLADNPIDKLVNVLQQLNNTDLDSLQTAKGRKSHPLFPSSNAEITNIVVGNKAENVIPAAANAQFNVRFNDLYTAANLYETLHQLITKVLPDEQTFTLTYHTSGNSFITNNLEQLSQLVRQAVYKVQNIEPDFNTAGGTSDARFINKYAPTIELGLLSETIHQANENCTIEEILNLSDIYLEILRSFFHEHSN